MNKKPQDQPENPNSPAIMTMVFNSLANRLRAVDRTLRQRATGDSGRAPAGPPGISLVVTDEMLDAGMRMYRSLQLASLHLAQPTELEQARALYAIMAPSSHRLTRAMIKAGAESLTLSESARPLDRGKAHRPLPGDGSTTGKVDPETRSIAEAGARGATSQAEG